MRVHTRKRILTAVLATGIALGGLAGPAGAGGDRPPEYVPFVTDFGASPDEGAPPAQPFIPFVTDFARSPSPQPDEIATPAEPAARTPDLGVRWRDVGIGAGFGIGLATVVAGALLAARARRPAGGAAGGGVRHRAES